MRTSAFGKRVESTVGVVFDDVFGHAVELDRNKSIEDIVNIFLVIAVTVGELFELAVIACVFVGCKNVIARLYGKHVAERVIGKGIIGRSRVDTA